MELKRDPDRFSDMRIDPFNRTTMELKPEFGGDARDFLSPFNRTTMELKQFFRKINLAQPCAFNRTTMELKQILCSRFNAGRQLLIEPLWN